jgi:hypothetical protein
VLYKRVSFILAVTTVFLWLLVKDAGQVAMYYAYIVGYTGVLIFQVNYTPFTYLMFKQINLPVANA